MLFYRAISVCALLLASPYKALGVPAPLDPREAHAHPAPVLKPREVIINSYDYTATNGPLTWWFTSPNSLLCKEGRNQTPILLDSSISQASPGAAVFTATNAQGTLENRGTAIEVVDVTGTISYAGITYSLDNFHFHTPSEHRINKEHYPVEMHFVHKNPSGNILVLGFLLEMSKNRSSNLVRAALAKVNEISPGQSVTTRQLNFSEISQYVSTKPLYIYSGSLTTPPCSEGLQWLVGPEPLEINVETYIELKKKLKYNARNIQNAPGQQNALEFACSGGV